jgi:hypothetical protein
VGIEPASSSTYPLCRARRRIVCGPSALDTHLSPAISATGSILRIAFRTKFLEGLEHLYGKRLLDCGGQASAFRNPDVFAATMDQLKNERWVVDIRPPFGGPEHVLRYLGRYTHRIAISNHCLVAFDGKRVRFRWKDYAHGGSQGVMKLKATEFLRRFFLHVLPKASCASATTACSPTASAKSACPWHKNCSRPMVAIRFPSPRRKILPNALRSGAVRSAAAPCASHEDLRQQSYPSEEISIPHDHRINHPPATCLLHACAFVCSTLHTSPFHRSALFIYRARQAATRTSTHRPPSPSAPIPPAEAHTSLYKQHSIPIIPASLTASAKYASGFLQTALSKTPRTKFRGYYNLVSEAFPIKANGFSAKCRRPPGSEEYWT